MIFLDLVIFVGPGFFSICDATLQAWNFERQNRHFGGIQLLAIFSKINRYSAKRSMHLFVLLYMAYLTWEYEPN